ALDISAHAGRSPAIERVDFSAPIVPRHHTQHLGEPADGLLAHTTNDWDATTRRSAVRVTRTIWRPVRTLIRLRSVRFKWLFMSESGKVLLIRLVLGTSRVVRNASPTTENDPTDPCSDPGDCDRRGSLARRVRGARPLVRREGGSVVTRPRGGHA